MAFEAVNRSLEDGRAAIIGVTDGVTDHCSVGEGLKKACQLTGNEFLCKGREKLLKWALQRAPRNEEGIVYHILQEPENSGQIPFICLTSQESLLSGRVKLLQADLTLLQMRQR